MSEGAKAPGLVPSRLKPYYGFKGLDRSRPASGMDDGKGQFFYDLQNGYADWRGIIRRESAVRLRASTPGQIQHLRFYNRTGAVWAEQDGRGIHLSGDRIARLDSAYPRDRVISSTVFRGKVQFMCSGFPIRATDGAGWEANRSTTYPGFGVSILGRLYCAGFLDTPTEVRASRVNAPDVFPDEEPIDSVSTNRAAVLDIQNSLGTADLITALGAFEADRLAIFTADQTIVYKVDPDLTLWTIDSRANIRVGCVSHNSVQAVGSDLLFCSRHGVHALSRSIENGISIHETTLSHEIEDLYKQMLREAIAPDLISASFDQDLGLYHIFFPRADGQHSRLVCNLKQGYEQRTWSTGTTVAARCADFLAGTMLFGTSDGTYVRLDPLTQIDVEDTLTDDIVRAPLDIKTPILWHGQLDDQKESVALILQAAGAGTLVVTAWDDAGQELWREEVQVDGRDDTEGNFPNIPLDQQYRLPFHLRYRGVQLQFRSVDNGDIRLLGFAIELAEHRANRGSR